MLLLLLVVVVVVVVVVISGVNGRRDFQVIFFVNKKNLCALIRLRRLDFVVFVCFVALTACLCAHK